MRAILLALLTTLSACCSAAQPATSTVNEADPTYSKELWLVCWKDGTAVSQYACPRPTPIRWAQFPLKVAADAHNSWPTDAAIDIWNEWLGAKVLVRVDDAAEADIVIAAGGPHEHYRGVTWVESPNGHQTAFILIFDSALWDPGTMTHEIGHALGLDHDTWRRSIMFPSNARVLPLLERRDREALRALHNLP